MTLTYFSRSQANKGKCLSSRYLHIYNFYYFHINTSDPYDETQGPSSKMGDLDLFFNVTKADKGKMLSSRYLHTYILYYFHITSIDPYDETQDQVRR